MRYLSRALICVTHTVMNLQVHEFSLTEEKDESDEKEL